MLVTFAIGAIPLACRNGARPSDEDGGADAVTGAGAAASSSASTGEPPVVEDDAAGGKPVARDRRPDAGAVFACRGKQLSLLGAALATRCAISEREWSARTREASDGGAAVLPFVRQTARREGDHVVLSLVNDGSTTAAIPLRFHPGHPELSFSVLATRANDAGQPAVFELAPPTHDAPEATWAPPPLDKGAPTHGPRIGLDDAGSPMHVYHALIELLPHGVAEARLAIDPRIVRRLDPGLPRGRGDAARLPKGAVTLYVGQLVAPTVDSPPAQVDWVVP